MIFEEDWLLVMLHIIKIFYTRFRQKRVAQIRWQVGFDVNRLEYSKQKRYGLSLPMQNIIPLFWNNQLWLCLSHFQTIVIFIGEMKQPNNISGFAESSGIQLGYTNTEGNLSNPQQSASPPRYYPMQPPMQPYPQPTPMQQYAPQPPMQQYAPQPPPMAGYFAACNQGVANGFGAMFFNIRDPNFNQTNTPIKQSSSLHLPVVVFNLIFLACLAVGLVGLNHFLDLGAMIGMIAGSYLVYLIVGICCSDIKDYVHNSKRFDNYQQTYNQMVKGRGYFRFWIECYHYETYRTRNGTSTRKVVTHTATQNFRPSQSIDESGEVGGIQDVTTHVFLHYLRRYYFTDDASQARFVAVFNSFVARNTRDQHQNYSQTFQIEGFEEFVSYTALGAGEKSMAFFYIFTLLGLAFPYACIFERTVSRYDVGILKRLTT